MAKLLLLAEHFYFLATPLALNKTFVLNPLLTHLFAYLPTNYKRIIFVFKYLCIVVSCILNTILTSKGRPYK